MSGSKHRPENVLNANSVLCNQQTGDNVTSQFVTGTAHHSHECTMTAEQRDTLEEGSRKAENAVTTCDYDKIIS